MDAYKKGKEFAQTVARHLSEQGIAVEAEYAVEVGLSSQEPKMHRFDFGNDRVIVECKNYQWTKGGNSPSAKISTLNEAMLFLHAASSNFRKMVFLSRTDKNTGRKPETFAEYYWRRHSHLVPDDVELWELDPASMRARRLNP